MFVSNKMETLHHFEIIPLQSLDTKMTNSASLLFCMTNCLFLNLLGSISAMVKCLISVQYADIKQPVNRRKLGVIVRAYVLYCSQQTVKLFILLLPFLCKTEKGSLPPLHSRHSQTATCFGQEINSPLITGNSKSTGNCVCSCCVLIESSLCNSLEILWEKSINLLKLLIIFSCFSSHCSTTLASW